MLLENSRDKSLVLKLQYEPVNLDLNKVCLVKLPDIPNMHEQSRKNQNGNEWHRYEKCG